MQFCIIVQITSGTVFFFQEQLSTDLLREEVKITALSLHIKYQIRVSFSVA